VLLDDAALGRAIPAALVLAFSPEGEKTMSKHVSISPTEAADRLAIRDLVEAYAHCADRLRYGDAYAKKDGTWLFAERKLYVDWIEERVLS
jgi:hypothetical protein